MANGYDDELGPNVGPYQQALIDTLRRAPALSTPTQGLPKPNTRQRYQEELGKYQAQMAQRPDVGELERSGRARYEAAGEDIGPAILLQALGGKLAPLGGQILQRSLASRAPQKVTGGEIIGGRFVEDPYAAQERNLKAQGFAVGSLRAAAEDEETALERERSHRATELARAEAERRHREQIVESRATRGQAAQLARDRLNWEMGKDKYTLVKDAEGQPIGRFSPVTGTVEPLQGGMAPTGMVPVGGQRPAGKFPEKPSPKASEDERRISSQVQRIVGSASLMTPEGMKPGAAEAAAGLLPGKVGAGVQSSVRGLSGTMGVGERTRQQTFQSQADIIDSLLYISTGAAYNKEQLEVMREAYMPQYTDNDAAIAAKAERLNLLVESAKVRAGRAWTQDAENALQQAFGGGAPQRSQLPAGSLPEVSRETPKVLPRSTAPRGQGASAADYKRRVGL